MNPTWRRSSPRSIVCALLLAASIPAPAQELGRLFFTPERREALDRQRESDLPEQQEEEDEDDPTLSIDGLVTRSGGRRTVWINGVAHEDDDAAVTVRRGDPGSVVVRTENGPARIGVGDTINPRTGETASLLGDGKIHIKR